MENIKSPLNNLRKALEIAGQQSVAYLTQKLSSKGKYATGNLISSLGYRIIKDSQGLSLRLSALDYFKYVDRGRRPGRMPPIKPIQSWIETKGIQIKNYSSRQSAFIIARSISRKGIKPLNLTEGLMKEMQGQTSLLQKAGMKDASEILDKMFIAAKKDLKK